MRWCAVLLLAGCAGRALQEPDVAPSDAATRVDFSVFVAAHDLGVHDLAIAHDGAHAHDAAMPVDLGIPPDLALPALDWQQVPVPNDETVTDISGYPSAVVISTQTWDQTYAYAPVYLNGGVYSYDGQSWTTLLATGPSTPMPGGVECVYAISATDIYASLPYFTRTDGKSSIIHYDGTQWTEFYSSTQDVYYRIRRLETGELAVASQDKSQAGVVMIYDGSTWQRTATPHANDFEAVWGKSPTDLYAAGWPKSFFHWDGANWTDLSPGGPGRFFFAWGTGNDVYFGGPDVYRYDGTQVTTVIDGPDYFYDVWQAASDRAYIVGCVGPADCSSGVLYSFDGAAWTPRTAPPGKAAERIWGRSDDDLWVANWGVLYHHGP
jgi:hypothetical protein